MHRNVSPGSDRSFGFTFTVVFWAFGIWPVINGGEARVLPLFIGMVFAVLATAVPQWLAVPNRLWFRFGLLLGRLVTPIVMFALYCSTVVPIALLMRLFRKDSLRLKWGRGAGSYWVVRDPPGPDPETMKNQF